MDEFSTFLPYVSKVLFLVFSVGVSLRCGDLGMLRVVVIGMLLACLEGAGVSCFRSSPYVVLL
jgi:hypothetical protein